MTEEYSDPLVSALQRFCMDCQRRGVRDVMAEFEKVFGKPDPVPGFYMELVFAKRPPP